MRIIKFIAFVFKFGLESFSLDNNYFFFFFRLGVN